MIAVRFMVATLLVVALSQLASANWDLCQLRGERREAEFMLRAKPYHKVGFAGFFKFANGLYQEQSLDSISLTHLEGKDVMTLNFDCGFLSFRADKDPDNTNGLIIAEGKHTDVSQFKCRAHDRAYDIIGRLARTKELEIDNEVRIQCLDDSDKPTGDEIVITKFFFNHGSSANSGLCVTTKDRVESKMRYRNSTFAIMGAAAQYKLPDGSYQPLHLDMVGAEKMAHDGLNFQFDCGAMSIEIFENKKENKFSSGRIHAERKSADGPQFKCQADITGLIEGELDKMYKLSEDGLTVDCQDGGQIILDQLVIRYWD